MTAPQILHDTLTTGVAAKRLGVSLRTVQLWCAKGALGFTTTFGGHRRIYEKDVARMLFAQRRLSVAVADPTPDEVAGVVSTSEGILLLATRLQEYVNKGSLDKEDPQKHVALACAVLRYFGEEQKESEIRVEVGLLSSVNTIGSAS